MAEQQAANRNSDGKKIVFKGGKVEEKDIVIFTRQFSTMIDAGLPLVQALEILAAQSDSKNFKPIIGVIKSEVESGSTFTDALALFPRVFSGLYVNMVAAGEMGGILDVVLQRLAGYMEKAAALRKKVKGAMTYPIAVLSIAAGAVGVIMIKVIPIFDKMFKEMGATLPAPTQLCIDISHFLVPYGWIFVVGTIFGLVTALKQIRRTDKGMLVTDQILLRLPVFGTLIQKVAVAKFTRTLGTLLASGVSIIDSLQITAKTSGNKVVEGAVLKVSDAVTEGRNMADTLKEQNIFPPMVTHMTAIGETTGSLDSMLSKIADFYDEEVDTAVGNLTQLMEPLLIVFLGGTVGFIVVAMYLPIFKSVSVMGG
ncbi:MAG: type II secretion system F family protein [Nitrospirae bacterium]|nr:type II secretion system F family protein [Nitrospirota bacterium]